MSDLEFRRTFTAVDIALFSAATWNPHLIHLDGESATREALPGVVVQSHFVPALVLAFLDSVLVDPTLVDPTSALEHLSWRNRAPVKVGEEVRIWVENSSGETGPRRWEAKVGDQVVVNGSLAVRSSTTS